MVNEGVSSVNFLAVKEVIPDRSLTILDYVVIGDLVSIESASDGIIVEKSALQELHSTLGDEIILNSRSVVVDHFMNLVGATDLGDDFYP
ncbi:hypothetical protein F3Y22_tig00001947pilonHSYRG00005 [Hibiscus syriacus]|uniref:Uncharacterized protein n=1 Tax=Hibiscus syriacus TaxID=106335 RepID=A0A6A3CYM6_HIBSY|nr:hypothetical protein F3Y22_tig00001947pilonHSYRG00005 [Hibiscus syriacus]